MNGKNFQYKRSIGWKKSFIEGFSQDDEGFELPWMTYDAIDFFSSILNKNHEIFEFGCGASTLFFARKVKKVTSLETNEMWKKIISEKLQNASLSNVEITLMQDGIDNNSYENYTKNFQKKFDFIIIDSIKRFNCAINSIDSLKSGGFLVLDDSQRKHYDKIFAFLEKEGFKRQDFPGISPGDLKEKNTTFFRKNN